MKKIISTKEQKKEKLFCINEEDLFFKNFDIYFRILGYKDVVWVYILTVFQSKLKMTKFTNSLFCSSEAIQNPNPTIFVYRWTDKMSFLKVYCGFSHIIIFFDILTNIEDMKQSNNRMKVPFLNYKFEIFIDFKIFGWRQRRILGLKR